MRRYLIVLSLLVLGTSMAIFGFTSRKSAITQIDLPRIKNNMTESLQFVEWRDLQGQLVLRLKNVSKKPITGYILEWGTGSVEKDFLTASQNLDPEGVTENYFSKIDFEAPRNIKEIRIALVMFDDSSSEGDYHWDQAMRDKRSGIKYQLQIIIDNLKAIVKSPQKVSIPSVATISSRNQQLVEITSESRSGDFQIGVKYAIDSTTLLLDDLDKWEKSGKSIRLRYELIGINNLSDGISKIIEHNEKLIEKL